MYKREMNNEPIYQVVEDAFDRRTASSHHLHMPAQARSTYPHQDSILAPPQVTRTLQPTVIHQSTNYVPQLNRVSQSFRDESIHSNPLGYSIGPAPEPFSSALDPHYYSSTMDSGRIKNTGYKESTLLQDYPRGLIASQPPVYNYVDSQPNSAYHSPKVLGRISPVPPSIRDQRFGPSYEYSNIQGQYMYPNSAVLAEMAVDGVVHGAEKLATRGAYKIVQGADRLAYDAENIAAFGADAVHYGAHKVVAGAEKVAYKAVEKTEEILQYSDMFVFCALDALLFFIISKATSRFGFISHLAMLAALVMSVMSVLPGLAEIYAQCLRGYLVVRAVAISAGLVLGAIAFYPALALSGGFFAVFYNILHIGHYAFALLSIVGSIAVSAITYPLFRKFNAMTKELSSGRQYYFTST